MSATESRPVRSPVRRPHAPRGHARRGQGRPHRHRHAQRVRPPDALRPDARASRWSRRRRCTSSSIILELLWFLRGDGNARWLQERGVTIWDEWARPDGDLGPVYGVQWRSWPTPDGGHIDQIAEVVQTAARPTPTRAASSSAPGTSPTLPKMALLPCHAFFQFYVAPATAGHAQADCRASCTSAAPTSSSACRSTSPATPCSRTCWRSSATSTSGDFIWTGGDCHIYDNHHEQVPTQLARDALPVPHAAHQAPAGVDLRLRSSRISKCRTTSTTRRSRRRWRCDEAVADLPPWRAMARSAATTTCSGRCRRTSALSPPPTRGHAVIMGRRPGIRCRRASGRCPGGATSSSPAMPPSMPRAPRRAGSLEAALRRLAATRLAPSSSAARSCMRRPCRAPTSWC